MEQISEWIDWTALAIEVLAVVIMVIFIVVGTAHWLMEPKRAIEAGYARYRVVLGKSLLVGLELLVAADIIRTVALDPTLPAIASLGLLMIVRTFLGWTVTLEVEGRWPWQGGKDSRDRQGTGLIAQETPRRLKTAVADCDQGPIARARRGT